MIQCFDGFYLPRGSPLCVACPTGGTCTRGQLLTRAGYWRVSQNSTDFLRCIKGTHCAGGEFASQCAPFRTGPLCGVCVSGYRPTLATQDCDICPPVDNAVTASVLIAAALLLLYACHSSHELCL